MWRVGVLWAPVGEGVGCGLPPVVLVVCPSPSSGVKWSVVGGEEVTRIPLSGAEHIEVVRPVCGFGGMALRTYTHTEPPSLPVTEPYMVKLL